MYSNMLIQDYIKRLSEFLLNPKTQKKFDHSPAKALVEAINITRETNRMKWSRNSPPSAK